MKKNYLIVGIVILLAIVVGAYYAGKGASTPYEPLHENKTTVVTTGTQLAPAPPAISDDSQFKCAQLGKNAEIAYGAKYPDKSEYVMTDSVYHYNSRLHECLWGRNIVYSSPAGQPFTVWKGITNLYSNKDVLYTFEFYSGDSIPKLTKFDAINYIDYPNEEGGGVIKDQVSFETLYEKTLTE